MNNKMGSGKPDPGRRYDGRSQYLKGGDFRGAPRPFHVRPFLAQAAG
jgi:hypothetical protein